MIFFFFIEFDSLIRSTFLLKKIYSNAVQYKSDFMGKKKGSQANSNIFPGKVLHNMKAFLVERRTNKGEKV